MSQTRKPSSLVRCPWANTPSGIEYHDREWGVPQHDDRVLFDEAGLYDYTRVEKLTHEVPVSIGVGGSD